MLGDKCPHHKLWCERHYATIWVAKSSVEHEVLHSCRHFLWSFAATRKPIRKIHHLHAVDQLFLEYFSERHARKLPDPYLIESWVDVRQSITIVRSEHRSDILCMRRTVYVINCSINRFERRHSSVEPLPSFAAFEVRCLRICAPSTCPYKK